MAKFLYSSLGQATLSSGIDSTTETITVVNGSSMATPSSTQQTPCVVWNDTDFPNPADDANAEIVYVTDRTANTITATRGQDSTLGVSHSISGKTYKIAQVMNSEYLNAITFDPSTKIFSADVTAGYFTIAATSNDPRLHFEISGGGNAVIGLDDSDSDTFKIAIGGTALDSGTILTGRATGIDCNVGRLAVKPATEIDALIDFNNSTTRWVLGLDADDAGRFKLAVGSSLSAVTLLEVGDVDGEGVTIYSKDATATSHAVLKINSSAADAQLTFTGSSGSWSMGHREEDDAFFINAGTSLSTGHIAQYDSAGNTLGWDFLGNKARFRDTNGAADGRVEIVPETGGDAYISFIGATSSWAAGIDESAGNFVISEAQGFGGTDRFVIGADGKFNFQPKDDSDNCDVNFYTPANSVKDSFIRFSTDNGTDVYSLGQDFSQNKSFRLTNNSDLTGTILFDYDPVDSTWDFFADTFKLLDNSSVEHLNLTSTNLEVYVTDNMRVKNATSDTSGWVTIQPSSNDDAKIVFQGPSDAFTMGRNHGLGDFVITSGGNLDATPLANSDSTGHWVFSCPVGNRAYSEMGDNSMTFWVNESETPHRLQFAVKDSNGDVQTGYVDLTVSV